MPILPLPQFEADLLTDKAEREAYEKLKAPKTLVVRFGFMKMVGEFPWDSSEKPGCGSKIVVRTHRGVEIGEMLTSTCANNGCSKSVSRKEMLEYIENSGGREYPFFTDGRALRVATKDDMDRQAAIEQSRHGLKMRCRAHSEAMGLPIKIVEVEPILGGELISVYYSSEDRVDFRDLVQRLRDELHGRVELKQVGARDEARLTADYERCGQYCCCKNFLKVLKPISMKSAKVQKATLDPLKISGRCGRLMCCLRYEDETYETLRKNLPRKKQRVGTPEGDGLVIDSQILTQLVLVELDEPEASGKPRQVAVPVEELTEPKDAKGPVRPLPGQAPAGAAPPRAAGGPGNPGSPPRPGPRGPQAPRPTPTSKGGPPPTAPGPRDGAAQPSTRGPERRPEGGPGRGPNRGTPRSAPPSADRPAPQPGPGPGPSGTDDDFDLDDIETDTGEQHSGGARTGGIRPDGPDAGSGGEGKGRRRGRRRRGRRSGGGGGNGGGPGGEPGSGGGAPGDRSGGDNGGGPGPSDSRGA